MSDPKTPNKPKTPKKGKLPPRDIGNGLFYNAFELPAFVTKEDQEDYYFRYSHEQQMQKLKKLGYEKALDEEGNDYRIGTKDSDANHILMKQPWQYRNEDLAMKRARVQGANYDPKSGDGLEFEKKENATD